MSKTPGRRRRREAGRGHEHGPLAELRRLSHDPGYLEFKERLGEPLTPAERAQLEAARAEGARPQRGGT